MIQEESFIGGGIDAVETAFTKGIAGTLFDIAKKVGGSTFKVIGDKRQAEKAFKQYAEKYKSRYGLLKLLGMQKGVPLESIYTPVRFLDQLSIRQFDTITNLAESYRNRQKRSFQSGQYRSQDGIAVANENQYLMVLGNPGAGKSTFLRHVGLEAFKGNAGRFEHDCIPVLLELKQFKTDTIDLIDAIAEEFKHFGFPPSKEFVERLLEKGKLLVLLDGLDEVNKNFINSVMDAIDNLVTRYGYNIKTEENGQNWFIASCRIAAYRSNLQHDFQVIELADFDDKQIKQFINNWFSSDLDKQSKTADRCWDTLNNENNKAAKELAQTPLLLTFLCLVYHRKQSFPPKRSRLYNKVLDILLEEWAAEKRLQQEPIYEGLHSDLEKAMLAEIAYEGFIEDQLFFDKKNIVTSIIDFLSDTVGNPKYLDGQKILQAIASQQGILVERAEDIYSFSHLTLQEYLSAQYISQEDARIKELVTKHLTGKRWQEVFLLVAGLKDDAGRLLMLMEKSGQQYINTPKLHNLLVWIKQRANTTTEDFQPVGKRAIVLANALANALAIPRTYSPGFYYNMDYDYSASPNAFANVLSNANALANNFANDYAKSNANGHINKYADAFARVYIDNITNADANAYFKANTWAKTNNFVKILDEFISEIQWLKKFQIYQDINYHELIAILENLKLQIPDDEETPEVRQAFGQKIIQIWLNAFHLTSKTLGLSRSELKALDNYLYINLLMVECKKAAVRVSRKTWSEIESRMLMPFIGV